MLAKSLKIFEILTNLFFQWFPAGVNIQMTIFRNNFLCLLDLKEDETFNVSFVYEIGVVRFV